MWSRTLIVLLTVFTSLPLVAGKVAILALYDATNPEGSTQRLAYDLAVQQMSNLTDYNDLDIEFKSSQCGEVEAAQVEEFIETRESELRVQTDEIVILGGCCHDAKCQRSYPQVTCNYRLSRPQANIVNLMYTLQSTYAAVTEILYDMHWNTVCIINSDIYEQEIKSLVTFLSEYGAIITLVRDVRDSESCMSQVLVLVEADAACLVSSRIPTLLLALTEPALPCARSQDNIFSLIPTTQAANTQVKRKLGYHLSAVLNTDLTVIDQALCAYESMRRVLFATLTNSPPTDLLHLITEQGEAEKDRISVLPVVKSVVLRRENELRQVLGFWNREMGFNITANLTMMEDEVPATESSAMSYDTQLTVLGIMCSCALVGVVYSIALITFNCSKSKDRTIKLTSPNINTMTCLGSLVSLLSIPLLGIERPITDDLRTIAQMQQAAIFAMSVGITIIYSSILVKTWRVHRIFKKMHLSSKGTKDEHLILTIVGLTIIDVTINTVWSKVDHIECMLIRGGVQLVCSSRYHVLWMSLLTTYKLAITALTLFYAWHVRHVKLPSLQDSHFILTNSLVLITILLTSLPALACSGTINSTRFATMAVCVLAMVFSTLSLLLAPKIFLIRNKDDAKTKSTAKFLFRESIKKQKDSKEKDEPNSSCWGKIKYCNSQSESSMGDSVLCQEIETLKQLVKEKDETIRELTDRLFFGADRFKAYINEKTSSYRRASSHPANLQSINIDTKGDNYQTNQMSANLYRSGATDRTSYEKTPPSSHENIYGADNHKSHRNRSSRHQQRLHPLPQFSPVSSVDSGNIEDAFSSRSQWKPSGSVCFTIDNSAVAHKHSLSREFSNSSHTLPPIRELSVNDLTNHCSSTADDNLHSTEIERSMTPTTDSAINMSRSVSSSEDESCSHRRSRRSPNMYEVADRVRHIILQQSDDVTSPQSDSSSSDHTLKSNCTILTTTTLSQGEENMLEHEKTGSRRSLETKKFSHIKPTIECERLAASSMRSRPNYYHSSNNSPAANIYTSNRHPSSPTVGNEVEMEIVFTAQNQV